MSEVIRKSGGKPGRSGRPLGSIDPHKAERDRLVLAYFRDGHTVRQTAKVFGISKSRIGKIVAGERPPVRRAADDVPRGTAQ